MKLKKIIPLIAGVLIFFVIAMIVVLNTKETPYDNPSSTVHNQGGTSEPAVSTDPVDIQLEEFEEMVSTAKQMLASGEIISVNRYREIGIYMAYCRAAYRDEIITFTDKAYSIDTANIDVEPIDKLRDLRYFLLLTQIMEKYSDCVVRIGDYVPKLNATFDVNPVLYLCMGYKDAGYETAEAFYNALIMGENTGLVTVFEFDLRYPCIYRYGERIDLYNELIDE